MADTAPIRYLVQINEIDLLHRLFETVFIPVQVANELRHSSAPSSVRAWIHSPPDWLQVCEAPLVHDPALDSLDSGERAAIQLGLMLKAELLLIDERRGNTVALSKGLETTGTLGILDLAARSGFVHLRDAIARLQQTNFRYRQSIIDAMLSKLPDGEAQ